MLIFGCDDGVDGGSDGDDGGSDQGCTAVGDGGASPTTKVYEFWVFYHQSVQILGF